MQTIKTGVVVALLLAVCYGAFVALNAPDPDLPSAFDEWASGDDGLSLDFDAGMVSMDAGVPFTPGESFTTQAPAGQPAPTQLTSTPSIDMPSIEIPALPPFAAPTADGDGSTTGSSQSLDLPVASGNSAGGNPPEFPQLSLGPNAGPATGGLEGDLMSGLDAFPAGNASTASNSNTLAANNMQPGLSVPSLDMMQDAARAEIDKQVSNIEAQANQMAQAGMNSLTAATNNLPNPSDMVPLLGGELANLGLDGKQPNTQYQANSTAQASASPGPSYPLPTQDFATARRQALDMADRGELKEALALLSRYYNSPELGSAESDDLVDILDGLAAVVVYSLDHHVLASAYTVGQLDTVESVAAANKLNPEFVAKVNGLGNSKALVPGSKIKVVPGPFRASINLSRGELTVFLGELYAGRFPISTGKDPEPRPGMFAVADRQRDRTYYGAARRVIQANDPMNPYGGYWINLGDDLCIHGTAEMPSSDLEHAGCISLAPLDASDVFDILTVDSQVQIMQ